MRRRVFPYKAGSRSASALAAAINGRVLKLAGSAFRPRRDDLIINWGSSTPYRGTDNVVNRPEAVARSGNKLVAFQTLRAADVSIPDFWLRREEIPADAFPIVCRTVLNGHSGRGIVVADTPAGLVAAPLYVRYVPKKEEYRIHVMKGRAIVTQRKARQQGFDNPNWRIRNHSNGFVFARDGFVVPADVTAQSIIAVAALGLDFGAVDVVWNEKKQKAFVLEVNTAPGLEGQTVQDYARALVGGMNDR